MQGSELSDSARYVLTISNEDGSSTLRPNLALEEAFTQIKEALDAGAVDVIVEVE